MSKQIRNGWILAAAVGLVCGVAWAAETSSVSMGPECWATADVVPGSEGMVLYSVRTDTFNDNEDLKIGFDPDGSVTVNGREVASFDGDHAHRVDADFYQVAGGGWACDFSVVDSDTSEVLHSETGRDMGDYAPTVCTATAEIILSLTSG